MCCDDSGEVLVCGGLLHAIDYKQFASSFAWIEAKSELPAHGFNLRRVGGRIAASVKPAANDGPGGGRFPTMREMMRKMRQPGVIPMTDPGRIRLENWALLDLIAAAYRVRA